MQGQRFALGQPALESDAALQTKAQQGGLEVSDGADADEQDQLFQELIELQLQLPEDEQQEEAHPAAGVAFSDSDNESRHSGEGRVPDRKIEPDVGDPLPPVQPPRVDPPRPPSPQPAEEDDVASVDSEITKPSRWGVFRITPKQPGKGRPHGGYEASCPFHKKSASTGCKKYLQLRDGSAAEKAKALLALKGWCNTARDYDRQWKHLAHFTSIDAAPSQDVVDAGIIREGPTEKPPADDELDATAAARAKAKAKAKTKAKAKAKTTPARGGRGRGGGSARAGQGQLFHVLLGMLQSVFEAILFVKLKLSCGVSPLNFWVWVQL